MPVEIFDHDGRKYNRSPLYSVTRKTLWHGAERNSFRLLPPGEGKTRKMQYVGAILVPTVCVTAMEISSQEQPWECCWIDINSVSFAVADL